MSAGPLAAEDADATARLLGDIAAEAGRVAASVPDRTLGREIKPDGSPATAADRESERVIVARLRAAFPGVPIVAEEGGAERHDGLFFLVDPLDGTREYLDGTDEYTVNIALVQGGRPVAAALAAPGRGRVWIAGRTAAVATTGPGPLAWDSVRTRAAASDRVALVSRRHADPAEEACLARLGATERRVAGSALKFGLIASGEADLYVRCGPTMEWDIAAGDLIVQCAGGLVVGPDGRAPTYGHAARGYRNGPFCALGDPGLGGAVRLPAACPVR